MPMLTYQEMTPAACMEVLRESSVTRAAFTDTERPYLVPMAFQLDADGLVPVIRLCMPDQGRKVDCLGRSSHVCLEFERPGCAWVDVVLLEGTAELDLWAKGEGIALHVRAEALSGRRFFLPE